MPAPRLLTFLFAALLVACGEPTKITPPAMELSATELSFSGAAGDPDPPAQAITIDNPGGGALGVPSVQVVYRSGAGWLDGAAVSLTGAAAPYTLTVSPRVGGLTGGRYEASVVLGAGSAANSPQSLTVRLEIAAPVLAVSPTSLSFSGVAGGAAPAAQDLTIANTGAGSLAAPTVSVTYASGAGWLTTSVLGSSAPYTVKVQPALGALGGGTYTATVRVASSGATGSPRDVAVTLQVVPGLVVTRLITSWGEGGTGATAAPGDVTAVALLQADCGGAALVDLAPGASAGTWTGVPSSDPWCARVTWADGRLGYYRGSGLALDLGEDAGGRADRQAAASATNVTPDLDGLDPWNEGDSLGLVLDSLSFYSWGAQAVATFDDFSLGWPLSAGDVALPASLGFSFDWRSAGPLLAAADSLKVVQYRETYGPSGTTTPFFYQRLVARTAATGLAMVDGQPLTVSPPVMTLLVDLNGNPLNDGSLVLNWKRSLFQAAVPPYTSTGSLLGHAVGVYATPAPLVGTAPLGALAMPVLLPTDTSGTPIDLNVTVPYARFATAPWQEYLHARYAKGVIRRAPGATTGLPEAEDLVYRYDAIAAAPATIQPLVGAVTSPTIDGQDALTGTGLTGVSLAPTLAWRPPATGGAPTSYRVELLRLTRSGTATVGARIAELVVGGSTTSLPLPAGLLEGATTYVARVTARSSPTDAGGVTPYRASRPGRLRAW